MAPRICPSIFRRRSLHVAILFIVSAVACFADSYANEGTIFITGTITSIDNQQNCDRYDCHVGSTWSLNMTFLASDWNAPWSNYEITSVDLRCFGGPPCFTDYHATSDFGWGPWLFDILYAKIVNGSVVDARVACGGYYIEWGDADTWERVDAFSGTTTGYVAPVDSTPEPTTIVTLASAAALGLTKRIFPIRG